jgi:anti-sigma factor (TIGR02949 family)
MSVWVVERMDEMNEIDKHDDIGCLEAIETLYAWLDGELDASQRAGFEHHLEHCKSCYSRAELERALTGHIRRSAGSGGDEEARSLAPASLQNRLDKLLKEL